MPLRLRPDSFREHRLLSIVSLLINMTRLDAIIYFFFDILASIKRKRGSRSSLLLSLILVFFTAPIASSGSDAIKICFYSSETNINNFKSLKMAFDDYLSKFGAYELQPFSDKQTFEDYIKGKDRCLLLLSSWHYFKINEDYSLKPLLVGVRNGKNRQKRLLVAKRGGAGSGAGKVGPIASASSVPHTKSVLKEMLQKNGAALESLKILTVPKDIDALMSVGFGMSRSALAMANSLEKLKMLNPALFGKLTILAEGKETMLLMLAAPRQFEEKAGEMIEIMLGLPTNPEGKKRIKMLGLDGWQKVDPPNGSNREG